MDTNIPGPGLGLRGKPGAQALPSPMALSLQEVSFGLMCRQDRAGGRLDTETERDSRQLLA